MHVTQQHGTILLAEDESLLRELGETILRHAGYTVVSVSQRDELESLMRSQDHDIDVLLTDVSMPDISGPDLAKLAKARWPKLRVIFMSGYSSEDLRGLDGHDGFLQKPFTPNELMETVRKTMSG
jgi:two-component system, cell cycle sensor histidine kinase and response regulator CckA